MEQKNYKRTSLKDRKREVEQVMEKWKNTFPDIGCYLNIPKSEFVLSTTMPNYEYTYMEDHDTEVLHFIENFDLDNCTIDQIRQANEYLEHDLTTSTELKLKVLLNKIDNKIRSKMDDAPFKEYHDDLITGKTKININEDMRPEAETEYTIDYKYLDEFIDTYDINLCITQSRIRNLILLLNETMINEEYKNKLLKLRAETLMAFKDIKNTSQLYNIIVLLRNYDEKKYETHKKDMRPERETVTSIDNDKKVLFVPQKNKEELTGNINEYIDVLDKEKLSQPDIDYVDATAVYNKMLRKKNITLEEFTIEQKEFFDKLHNLGKVKQKEYSRGLSPFHNFEKAKGLSFHTTKPKVAWEYMVKHLQSVKDLLNDEEVGNEIDPKVVDEKIGDIIVYMTLIRSMLINKE